MESGVEARAASGWDAIGLTMALARNIIVGKLDGKIRGELDRIFSPRVSPQGR